MKGFVIDEYIKPEQLLTKYSESIPLPVPKADELLVDVHAAGLNFYDTLQLQGKYQNQPPFPWVPGSEFAGVIRQDSPIPQGCPFKKGDRVFGAAQGGYADVVAAPYLRLLPVPEGLSFSQAAGLHVTYPTAYGSLVVRANLKKDEWCLVHAAAGGVGLSAVQVAKALGAKVIATAGNDEKLQVAKNHGGADYLINYRDEGWQQKVKDITGGRGVDVIYDPVGLIHPSLKCIAWNGRAVVVGFAGGTIEKVPMNLVLLKNISIVGLHWGAYTKNEPETIESVWAALFELIRQGRLRPTVFSRPFVGLKSLPEGLRALANRETWGKAVLTIRDPSEDPASSASSKL